MEGKSCLWKQSTEPWSYPDGPFPPVEDLTRVRRLISGAADRYLVSYENQSPIIWRIKDDLLGPAGKETRRGRVENILTCMLAFHR